MMEEKQLDFNRPLISVRRPESKSRSSDSVTNKTLPSSSPPVYKSDIKSGPVRNPGTVPFQWEHKPGKPKDETKPDFQTLVEPQHFVPKLPPGRRTRADHQTTDKKYHVVEETKSYSTCCFDDDNDDDNDTYLDANDTLSRSESFFYNCSNVSGVSGLDGSGIQVDRQTQDLMMGRFLPAAKALASETPKKPPKPEEPLKPTMKKEKKQNKVEKNPFRFNQEEEDGDASSMMGSSGICGLVPQLCMRSSFGLLNTVPSVRMQTHRAVSVRRMRSKYQDSSSTPSNEETRKLKVNDSVAQEPSQDGSLSVSSRSKASKNFGELLAIDDNTWELSTEAPVAEKTLYVDTVHSVDKKVQEESKKKSLEEHPSLDIVLYEEEEAILQPKSIEEMNDNRDEEGFTEFSSQKVVVALPESNVVEMITKDKKMNLEVESQRNTANLESSRLHHRSSYHIVPPPPLPKAPSDSWLKRTLITIPSKNNSFTWLQSLGTDDNNNFTKTHQANPKWETMVKTPNTQQGFVCFTKETLNSIPEA